MEEKNFVPFDEIPHIESLLCVLGLRMPETASPFQKAALTLAHLAASCRDFVLGGRDIPGKIIDIINMLAIILDEYQFEQRKKEE